MYKKLILWFLKIYKKFMMTRQARFFEEFYYRKIKFWKVMISMIDGFKDPWNMHRRFEGSRRYLGLVVWEFLRETLKIFKIWKVYKNSWEIFEIVRSAGKSVYRIFDIRVNGVSNNYPNMVQSKQFILLIFVKM